MRFLLTILAISICFAASAQSNLFFNLKSYEKKGDAFYESYSFQKSLDSYQHAIASNPSKDRIKLKIAECYRMLNQPHNAEKWYSEVIENDGVVKPEHKLHYAQILSSNGKYDESKLWYHNYSLENSDDSRAKRKIESLENIHELFADSLVFSIDKLNINSIHNDFSPSLYHNGLVFVSGREQSDVAIESTFNWDHSNFLDLFYTEENEDGTSDEPKSFHPNIVRSFHEGPTTFFDNETKMIFTANNYKGNDLGRSRKGVSLLKLYYSERVNDEWIKPKELPFNNDQYSVGHPSMSHDQKILYFSSNMPDGFGGTDLYKISYENGNWGVPENLGDLVNTEGDEMFPYIHHDGALYFASNGHGGLGGLDIYRLNASGDLINNMGHPFNSRWDDLGLIIDPEGESGYFSSNREGGKGGDDIYFFELKKVKVDFFVKDSLTNTPLDGVELSLSYEETGHSFYTNTMGRANSILNPIKDYVGTITKPGYNTKTIRIDPSSLTHTDPFFELLLVKDDADSSSLLAQDPNSREADEILSSGDDGYSVNRRKVDENDVLKGTDENFRSDLDGKRLDGVEGRSFNKYAKVTLINSDEGWKTYVKTDDGFFQLQENGSEYSLKNSKDQLSLSSISSWLNPAHKVAQILNKSGFGISSTVAIDNALFDYNKFDIRNNSSAQMDRIIVLLRENPDLKITLNSHTDSRGGNTYNLSLSEKRGRAVADYLESLGIDKTRIQFQNLGEGKLLNNCGNGKKCSENDHEINRRTTFTLHL